MENSGFIDSEKKPYAGMIDKGADFFKRQGKLYVSHDWKQHQWPDFPPYVMGKIEEDMMNNPIALKCLGEWENLLPENYDFQYISCCFGGLDDEPDITVDGKVCQSEYVPCKLRGQCRFEGKLCRSIKVENGVITKRELDVLQLIQEDNKIIADKLCVSLETVNTHILNIREKIGQGINSKPKLCVWASKKGII